MRREINWATGVSTKNPLWDRVSQILCYLQNPPLSENTCIIYIEEKTEIYLLSQIVLLHYLLLKLPSNLNKL